MFQITEEQWNDLELIKIVNQKSGAFVSIVPKFGVNLVDLTLQKREELIPVIDGNSSLDEFSTSRIFNNAKLIPFPNRIKDGFYNFDGKNYQLDCNLTQEKNAIHGLLYDKEFDVIRNNLSDTSGEVVFSHLYDRIHSGYPFKFETEISFKLSLDSGFTCTTHVTNRGKKAMPFGDGWHPFFNFNKQVDLLYLKFNSKYLIDVDERMIPKGKITNFKEFNSLKRITTTRFDSCFFLDDREKIHRAEIYDPDTKISLILWQETGRHAYNYLQVYIPPDRHSIALEPMTCNIDAFNNKDGLIILQPGESYQASYGVSIY
jgi:aldose 1-epimerase